MAASKTHLETQLAMYREGEVKLILAQKQRIFDQRVGQTAKHFPNEEDRNGQLYGSWKDCAQHIKDVLSLHECVVDERTGSTGLEVSEQFCKLILTCKRYLYEVSRLTELQSICHDSVELFETLRDGPKKEDLVASCKSQKANLLESIGEADQAILINQKLYGFRLRQIPQNPLLLALTANNLVYCHNTINDHLAALSWFRAAEKWFDAIPGANESAENTPALVRVNIARCMMYLGDLNHAQALLELAQPELSNSKELAMSADACFVRGTLYLREGTSLSAWNYFVMASQTWGQQDRSRRHPFAAACLYRMATCYLASNYAPGAIDALRKSVTITSLHKDIMPVEHARSLFGLARALGRGNSDECAEGMRFREEALKYFQERKPDAGQTASEADCHDLIPVFWR